jgi:hypothetical protein
MAEKTKDADLNRDIQRFSMKALELAKAVVDGAASADDAAKAKDLAAKLPEFAATARELAPAYREGAMKALSEARLDLAYVQANGGIPSSIRLGWYIKEKGEEPGL